jgi:chromosome segregation ATPase
MPGPRIYTEAWERLKVAAKEMEAREAAETPSVARSPEEKKQRKAPRLSVIALAVLALVTIAAAGLWIDSQAQLMSATRDVTDYKTRLVLLQEKIQKMEEERQRLEDENGTLSVQYEKRAAEFARLEDELNALRTQKEKSKPNARQNLPLADIPTITSHGALRAPEQPSPSTQTPEKSNNAPKLAKPQQQDVKVYKIE